MTPPCENGESRTEFPDEIRRRIEMTVSCHDSKHLPRHPDAGRIISTPEGDIQVMRTGVKVRAYGYYGAWMAEIIERLRGVHEPQEELVFDSVLKRLGEVGTPSNPVMVELGSFWAYYSLWFRQQFPSSMTILLEPDPMYLEVGKENFRINGEQGEFVQGLISGPEDVSSPQPFITESSQEKLFLPSYSLEDLLTMHGVKSADLVLADIQGAETPLLENSREILSSGAVRFLIVSTHDMSISGDPLTHQKALEVIEESGGHVIAEHSISESFSGDGLIVASFHELDRDFVVEVSRARAKDSLFGEWEPRIQKIQAAHELQLRMLSRDVDPEVATMKKIMNQVLLWIKNRLSGA
jgi:hypothetical protein